MLKHLERNVFNVVLVCLTVAAMVLLEFIAPDFSTVFLILIGGAIGLSAYLVGYFKAKRNSEKGDKE